MAATPSHSESVASFEVADNDRDLAINLSQDLRFAENEAGEVEIIDSNNNVRETLPSTATDQDGETVTFLYEIKDPQTIEVVRADEFGFVNYGWWDSWGRCAAGTIGGTGGGAIGGAAAGTVVPILGNGVGAIVGGVSGGLTGAAASC